MIATFFYCLLLMQVLLLVCYFFFFKNDVIKMSKTERSIYEWGEKLSDTEVLLILNVLVFQWPICNVKCNLKLANSNL